MEINALAAQEAKAPVEPFTYEADAVAKFGAEIEITHCGVCHSDLHLLDGDWSSGQFPLVAGHEIIGMVKSVGSEADKSLVGQRVGIGWQRGSCLKCEWCISGQENVCAQSVATCVGNYGGFAEKVILDSRFVHPIPDKLDSVNAAPLLCAGITVYSPLTRYAKAGTRVGVMGIGGLGHLAIQYAHKMGCNVTAFSTRDSKRDEARQLGANQFINGKDEAAMKSVRNSLDVIIATAPVNIDWTPYINALRPGGTLCFVGAPPQPVPVLIGAILRNKQVAGSVIGGRQAMRDMLRFSALHDVVAWTEKMPMDSVNDALSRLRDNDVRYRFVLEN